MHEELAKIKEHARFAIDQAVTPDALEKVRLQYFGRRNGALTAILRALKDLPEDIRKEIGQNANRLRRDIETWLDEKATEIQKTYRESVLEREWLDVTRPGVKKIRGSLHPITLLIREVLDIFRTLGFIAVDGPEVETEYYNFDALNIPADHPARDMWDTFWLDSQFKISDSKKPSDRLLLRTHTSPVQVRYMEAHNPPLRIVVPGRVYRYEATDASHDIQFHQLEGLVVDRDVSIAHAKAIIQLFFSRLFKTDIAIRLRPSYFPFTEPSFEIDISCVHCRGGGCSVCKKTGWLELAGAGMVHPHVFKAAGYATGEWRGFAFGMGLERLAMMKYKIPDIRLFHSGDIRFLNQFIR